MSPVSEKKLRAEINRLGITAELAGCPLDELVEAARGQEDPLGFLETFAPIGDVPSGPPCEDQEPAEPAAAPPPPVTDQVEVVTVRKTLDLPLADGPPGRVGRHVEVKLNPFQAAVLTRLEIGLRRQGASFTGPSPQCHQKPVLRAPDAIRWLLEQLGDAGPNP